MDSLAYDEVIAQVKIAAAIKDKDRRVSNVNNPYHSNWWAGLVNAPRPTFERLLKRNVYFVFCRNSQSRWSWIARKGWRHVYMYVSDGQGLYRYSPNGINLVVESIVLPSNISLKEYLKRVSDLAGVTAVVGVEVEQSRALNDAQPFVQMGLTCSELCRIGSGVQVGRVWTPRMLYKRLMKYSYKRNFEVFYIA